MQEGIGWIVDADVSGYFDSIERTRLREVLRQRVNDGRVWRLIGKWLRAGVMEEGILTHPETGVVQGGVISPILANIFLHEVLDEWCEREVRPRMKGRCFLIRFADDFVIGCELEGDARRIMAVLPKRFARFGLRMHPTKTVLIAFGRPEARPGADQGNGTFDLLGLTHYWARSRRGVLGDQTQDGQKASLSRQEGVVAMVSHQSSHTAAIPVPHALPEAAWAFPVLRYPRELPSAGGGPSLCGEGVAVLAESP
jgi:Reverse transcriptase (RNA-dependent DNA polymerase)